ncbi:hypothetical protein M5X11_25210 [Paenibacillus alginolyticus]|uniref:hypothetical protein n=1 Tax=Paenibacillus alginolyticus TaxID=59839 RepID=UPI0003F65A32|nr:hypothetical protein [Paenibacillus alginolyticus]MCY9668182.1 hypothetical protein [Paenibacillus alginolyticus]
MPQGKLAHSKQASPSHQNSQQSQVAPTSKAGSQASPLGANFFMQMQRTVGNRDTQAFANQLIQRNVTAQTPQQAATVAPTTAAPATIVAPTVIPAASTLHPTGDDTKDNADMTSGVTSTFSDSFGKRSDDLKESYDKTKDAGTAQQSATMGAVASTADLVGGPFQIMSAIRETLAASRERKGHDKRFQYAGTGSTMIEASGKMVSGSAGLVDKAAKSTGHKDGVGGSSSASDYTGTVAEAISAVKNTIMAVKAIYDMYKKHSDNGGLNNAEKARGVIEIISNAIQAAQSGIKVAKGIMDIMESSTASLTAVIPGVSIAVSGVKIAIKTVDVIKAGLNRSAMTTLKRDFKGKAGNADVLKEKRWYTRNAGVDKAKLAKKNRISKCLKRVEMLQQLNNWTKSPSMN